jgi:hypothetical protein
LAKRYRDDLEPCRYLVADPEVLNSPLGLLLARLPNIAVTSPQTERNIDSVADMTLTTKLPGDFLRRVLQAYGIWITAGGVATSGDGGEVRLT